jgi:creatinine amidohydrolase
LRPEQLDGLWSTEASAIVAWGALEWHGSHLPLGLDGIVAEWFARRLSDLTQSVLLPTMWLPITTLPHRYSQQVRTETLRMILDDLFAGLHKSGARKIAVVTGHYAQGHAIELSEAALRAMDDHDGLLVFVGSPLELLAEPELMDHAAHNETSQLLAIRPDLVHLEELPSEPTSQSSAILGESPQLGSADEGRQLLQRGLDAWIGWMSTASRLTLDEHYRSVFDRYQEYVDKYYEGSWEDAIQKWWRDQSE